MAEALKIGDRVRSLSDGFTRGRVGAIEEWGRGGSPPEPAAFVRFDDIGLYAVAVRLLARETVS